MAPFSRSIGKLPDSGYARQREADSARSLIDAHDADIAALNPNKQPTWHGIGPDTTYASVDHYLALRTQVLDREKALDFDFSCRNDSSADEHRAEAIIQRLKREDRAGIYDAAPSRTGFGGQKHPRFPGDHFLSNLPLINQTALFDVARHMPKGAHLHIHFNACLVPNVLLHIAKSMDRMFITSNIPLVPDQNYVGYDCCEIQFPLMSPEKECPGDLFSPKYESRQTTKFQEFLKRFPQHSGLKATPLNPRSGSTRGFHCPLHWQNSSGLANPPNPPDDLVEWSGWIRWIRSGAVRDAHIIWQRDPNSA